MTTINSFTDRRKAREEIERTGAQGERVDVAVLCCCPDCGQAHYRPKGADEQKRQTEIK